MVAVDRVQAEQVAEEDREEVRRLRPARSLVEVCERHVRETLGTTKGVGVAGEAVQQDVSADCRSLVVAPVRLIALTVERQVIPQQTVRPQHAAFDPAEHPSRPCEVAAVVRRLVEPHREQRTGRRRDRVAVVVALRVRPEDAARTRMSVVVVPGPADDTEELGGACKSDSTVVEPPPLYELERDPFVVVVVDVAGPHAGLVGTVLTEVALEPADPPLRLADVEAAALRDGRHRDRRSKRLRVRPRRGCPRDARRPAVGVRSRVEELVPHRPERDRCPVRVRVALRRSDQREPRHQGGRERKGRAHVLTLLGLAAIYPRPG